MSSRSYGEEGPIKRWDELAELYQDKKSQWRGWAFRGQQAACWELESSLERKLKRFEIPPDKQMDYESYLVREFQRHRSRTGERTPIDVDDAIEWLALMQHHGAPTRLLDFTYSFWMAVFFAIENIMPGKACKTCALWVFDVAELEKRALTKLDELTSAALKENRRDRSAICEVFAPLPRQERMVWLVNPFILNERLSVQQGVFMAGTDLTVGFMGNLAEHAALHELQKHCIKITIDFSLSELKRALTELHAMNISRTSLFPGIDGFAQSLGNRLAMHHFDALQPGNLWRQSDG